MAKERRDLPILRAYAKKRGSVEPISRGKTLRDFGGLATFVSAVGAGWFVDLHWGWLYALGAFILAASIVGSVVSSLDRAVRAPRTADEKMAVEVHDLYKQIGNMGKQRIQKDIDPVAGQILEACAMQLERVEAVLGSASWEAKSTTEPWKSVRDQSLSAARAAMDEAVVLCSPNIGAGRGAKAEDEWSKVVEAFFEKGVGEAIRRADRMLGPRPPLDPTLVPTALQPALSVATKMQALADEVDAASETSNAQSSVAASSLDLALQNLKAVQMAEQELDSDVQLHQRLQ